MKNKPKHRSALLEERSQIGLYEMLALARPDSNHENSALVEMLAQRMKYEVDQGECDT